MVERGAATTVPSPNDRLPAKRLHATETIQLDGMVVKLKGVDHSSVVP